MSAECRVDPELADLFHVGAEERRPLRSQTLVVRAAHEQTQSSARGHLLRRVQLRVQGQASHRAVGFIHTNGHIINRSQD